MAFQFRSTLRYESETLPGAASWLLHPPGSPRPHHPSGSFCLTDLFGSKHALGNSLACPFNPNTILRAYQPLVRNLVNVKLYFLSYFSKST